MPPRLSFALLAICSLSCSPSAPPSATLVLDSGMETDTLTRAPVPSRLELDAVALDGTRTRLLSASWPSSTFDVGDLPIDGILGFEVTGLDSTGRRLVRGRTLPLVMSALEGAEVPVLVGRVGETARPNGLLTTGRRDAVAAFVDDRYLFLSGGTSVTDASGAPAAAATTSAFDLGLWASVSGTPVLPRVPSSMAVARARFALLVAPDGASWLDFANGSASDVSPPAGMQFADVAGGSVVPGDQGASYLVGATRDALSETRVVLRIGADLALRVLLLAVPRRGAAATWVAGRGLVVAGGTASPPGVEVLAPGADSFVPLAFPADAVSSAGAAPLDGRYVLLAGGADPSGALADVRVLDLSCSSECATMAFAGTARSVDLSQARAFALVGPDVLLAGTAAGVDGSTPGETRLVRLTLGTMTAAVKPIALREPRSGATVLPTPNGMFAVAGGLSTSGQPVRSVEMLFLP